ncbi:hypothetical protein [Phocaeicola coprophilus]|uniref:hypothetical protein n=1 Tax=Phocaeicola coprophilus TaxID=387090 RepID=UPI0026725774|nr:hypothetical protein [Phocaeicola coprophilus]
MKTNRIVCRNLSALIIIFFGLFMCQACSKDTPNLNTIRVQVETNSDEPVRIYGLKGGGETGIVIKKNYEETFELGNDDYLHDGFSIETRCKDGNTLITIKVWVNGKLKSNVSGNKYITTGYILCQQR